MGLIVGNSITKLMKGYPTVSDKYNVQGGILEGSTSIPFGTVLMNGSAPGHYKPAAGLATAADVRGIALATNVKLSPIWPADGDVLVAPGEVVNLLVSGFVAVEVATTVGITEGAKVYVTAAGKFTPVSTSNIALDAYFTGVVDGSLAEIAYRI